MQLLDRYLQAVGNNLPKKKRDDILSELRANILEGVEDREAELGRPLTLDEEEAVLKQYGNPVVVAVRYWPKQYLIGPTVFPYYVYALQVVIPFALVIACIVNIIELTARTNALESMLGVIGRLPGVIFMTAAWVTIGFVALEFAQVNWSKEKNPFSTWSPRKLPPYRPQQNYSVWKTAFEVTMTGLGLAWMLSIPFAPHLALGPGAEQMKYLRFAPECLTFYWASVAVMAAQWLAEMGTIAEVRLRPYRQYIGMVGRAASAGISAWLLKTPTFLSLSDLGREAGKSETLVQQVNLGLHIGLKVFVAITVAQILWELMKMVLRRSGPKAVNSSTQVAL